MISKSTIEYLKTIYLLSQTNDRIRVTDIAKEINCSKPSVTKQMNILKEKGLIEYTPYSSIQLTSKGVSLAKKTIGEGDLYYLFFKDILKLPKEKSLEESKNLKGILSDESINALAKYVNKTLGFANDCNFNIMNDKCLKCIEKLKEENIYE